MSESTGEAGRMPAQSAGPGPAAPAIPVICDQCRAEGLAGDDGFAEIADILEFEPVPRRAQANNWTPEHQRAFIAALAITGSASAAARTIGRHSRGVEKLRQARGGRPFAEAWDAALDIARERELARLREDMAELSKRQEVADARYEAAAPAAFDEPEPEPRPRGGRRGRNDEPRWGSREMIEEEERADQEYEAAMERTRERILRGRRLMLWSISEDADKRAAWEVLVGPVDWDKAAKMEEQDNEPFRAAMMRQPDTILSVESGMLHGLVGAGRNFPLELLGAAREYEETGSLDGPAVRAVCREE